MYDTKEEFNQKLSSCVVLFNKIPVFIVEATGNTKPDIKLLYQNLRTKESSTVSAWDSGWDFRNLGSRLGYTNAEYQDYKQALYLTRMAVRQASNTQGLSQRNVKIPSLKSLPDLDIGSYRLSWTQLYPNGYFLDTLERKYPSLFDLKDLFSKTDRYTSKAFNPRFAINKPKVGPFYLEYRGIDIGYSDDMEKWRIGEDYSHLRESIEHVNLRIA